MHQYASFNHKILSTNNIKINAISSASLYGKGVFTTIAIYDSKPFLWEKHWKRLNDNAQKLGIDLSEFSRKEVENLLKEIIEKNTVINGRCRITFFDESSSKVWQTLNQDRTSVLLQTADFRETKDLFSVGVSSYSLNSKSPTAGTKSNNYLENHLALEQGKEKGFDEMILSNENGEVVSFCMGNIFWLEYGSGLYTPSLETGCLAGTTREFIMENIKVQEVKVSIDRMLEYIEAMYITSSGLGVKHVNIFNEENFPFFEHEVLEVIENELAKI